MIVVARLIKRATADGLFEIEDHIPLGKEYLVELNSRRTQMGIELRDNTMRPVWVEVIATQNGRFLPTEILEIGGPPK